ncbi:MAG TPA: thioredoxin domain-containing protein [Allosphingosinicella sp.]|jgi:protein-disulfide isomerase
MKVSIGGSALALALLLTGCTGEGEEANSAAGNGTAAVSTAPLPQVEAPNGDWTQVVTQTQDGGFLMGNPNAPVKLIEYASLTCPHCAAFSQEGSEKLKNEYVKSGQLSFEFRNFVMNATDLAATMLVRCQGTGPFFKSVEQLFATQQQWTAGAMQLSPAEQQRIAALPRSQQTAAYAKSAGIDTFFRQRGMPEARVNSCLADQQSVEKLVQSNETAVERDKVEGTPTFLINGETVGSLTWAQLEPLLRKEIG